MIQWAKLLPVTLASHLVLAAPLPANDLGKATGNVQNAWVAPPMWETLKKRLAPGFSLGQPWQLQLSGERTKGWKEGKGEKGENWIGCGAAKTQTGIIIWDVSIVGSDLTFTFL